MYNTTGNTIHGGSTSLAPDVWCEARGLPSLCILTSGYVLYERGEVTWVTVVGLTLHPVRKVKRLPNVDCVQVYKLLLRSHPTHFSFLFHTCLFVSIAPSHNY